MECWILYDSDNERACFYDSVTEQPFGRGFMGPDAKEEAEAFWNYLGEDPRRFGPEALEAQYEEFHTQVLARCRCSDCDDVLVDYDELDGRGRVPDGVPETCKACRDKAQRQDMLTK